MGQGQIFMPQSSKGGSSSLFGLMNMLGKSSDNPDTTMSSPAGYDPAAPTKSVMPEIQSPELGDALSRRSSANMASPESLVAQGIKHADDPNTPLDFDTRMHVLDNLVRAQIFGKGGSGGYEKGAQGEISSGKAPDTGGLGKIMSLVALV